MWNASRNRWAGLLGLALSGLYSARAADERVFRDVYQKSLEWEARGDCRAALSAMEVLGPAAAKSYLVQLRTGWLAEQLREPREAARHYHEAALLSPRSIEARLALLQPLRVLERHEDIEAVAREILDLDKRNYTAWIRLIGALREQKKTGAARSELNQLQKYYPCDGEALEAANTLSGRAFSPRVLDLRNQFAESKRREDQQDIAAAIAALDPGLRTNPTDYCANLRLAWLYARQGNFDRSLHCSDIAIHAVPNSVEARLGLVPALVGQQDYKALEAAMKLVLAIDPLNYVANLNLAQACRKNGKGDKAIAAAADLLVFYPGNVPLLVELASAHAAQRQTADAARVFRQVTLLDPQNATAAAFFRVASAR